MYGSAAINISSQTEVKKNQPQVILTSAYILLLNEDLLII